MDLLNPSRRKLFVAVAGVGALGLIALILVAGVLIWRFTAWGSEALHNVTDATMAAVSQSREDATRVLKEAEGSVANSVAALALSKEQKVRALEQANASVARTRELATQALAEPEAAIKRAADAAAQDVSRGLLAAAAAATIAVGPVVAEHAASAARSLKAISARNPTPWPEGLALRQVHFQKVGTVTEYGYVAAAPDFQLSQLREQLVVLGYTEHVIAQGTGTLEAVYRGDRQLLLSATTRDGRKHIDVRELTLTTTAHPGS